MTRLPFFCRCALLSMLALALAAPAGAQEAPAELSLEEALILARRHNPNFQTFRNDVGAADWRVREAYSAFLPTANLNGGMRYQDEGELFFGSFTGADVGVSKTPPFYFSDYGVSLGYQINGQSIFQVGQERANRRAVEAGVQLQERNLETAVTRQYVAALRERDNVELAGRELERAQENFRLADARVSVGVAIPLERKQAEVDLGRAEVGIIRARAAYDTQKLRLLEQLGVELDTGTELTTRFEVFQPDWPVESLVEVASRSHPQLRSADATVKARSAGLRMARSSYLPTLTFNANWSGFTRQIGNDAAVLDQARQQVSSLRRGCLADIELNARLLEPLPGTPTSSAECADFDLSPADEVAVLQNNRVFPFDFTPQPFTFSLRVNYPIFQGFTRQRQVEEAAAAMDDARHQHRAQTLRIEADVEVAYLNLEAAYQAVGIEERNLQLANEQLEQAQERYRVGLTNFIDLAEANIITSRAEQALLNAVYAFHDSLADLEGAVGQSLRP